MLFGLGIDAANTMADRLTLKQLVVGQGTHRLAGRIVKEVLVASRAPRMRSVDVPSDVDSQGQVCQFGGNRAADLLLDKFRFAKNAASFRIPFAEDEIALTHHFPANLATQQPLPSLPTALFSGSSLAAHRLTSTNRDHSVSRWYSC